MKISFNPMPALRAAKVQQVNARFAAMADPHRDAAHAQKRQWAASQDSRLAPEAELRGMTVAELAALILSKSDVLAERELQRQKALAKVAAATTLAALANVDI